MTRKTVAYLNPIIGETYFFNETINFNSHCFSGLIKTASLSIFS